MKAIVYSNYGSPDVLKYAEIETPRPGDNEVLIRVRAAALNPLDWHFMRGSPYLLRIAAGLRKPKDGRLGVDVAGLVAAVGTNVKQFKPGDEVFGSCRGALAEYACTSASTLALKPDKVTFEQAASVCVAALTALQALRDTGKVQPGHKVLINGAAGGVGTFAVQIAKSFGADVTGVCSTANAEMVRRIGADRIIDYTREDFTQQGERYHLILDCMANHSVAACRRILHPGGVHIAVGGPTSRWMIGNIVHALAALAASQFMSRKFRMILMRPRPQDLATIADLMAAGTVTPVIDRCCGLTEAPAAIRYLEEGHARGKVVITVAGL